MSAALWVIYSGPNSWCKLVTLFDSYSDDGVIAGIWVIHTGAKSGCKLVTEFGGYSYDGVSTVIGVQHTEVALLLCMTVSLYKFEYTVAHLCPITACGMTSFGGLLSE